MTILMCITLCLIIYLLCTVYFTRIRQEASVKEDHQLIFLECVFRNSESFREL